MYCIKFYLHIFTRFTYKFMQSDETHACQLMFMIFIMPHDLEMFRNI